MSAAIVATPTAIQTKANSFWRFSLTDRSSHSDDRLTSLIRRRRPASTHDCVTRRKSADNLRNRNSWRYSWRNILTKPFHGQSNGLRGKNKVRKKSTGSLRDVSEESVENRKKMDELLQLWHSEIIDSSDESSDNDDDRTPLGRRRSCSPRVFGDVTSSSEDEDDVVLEAPVSLYVSEGPSQMSFGTECNYDGGDFVSPGQRLSSVPRRNSLDVEIGANKERLAINSASKVLTRAQTMINQNHNNNVIGPLQIYDLERSGDSEKLLSHTCSCSCTRYTNIGTRSGVDCSAARTSDHRPKCVGGQSGRHLKAYSKDDLEIGRHRLGLVARRAVALKGTINASRKDRLSVTLENNHFELKNEELLNERHNEDMSVGGESRETHNGLAFTSTGMEDIFSAQDLTAIRRFLGMSLQQIDAKKILEGPNAEAAVDFASKAPVNKEEVSATNDVLPDYPSTYLKNVENIKEKSFPNHDESSGELQCEFKQFGCQFSDTGCPLHLHNHMTSSTIEHLNMVSKTANDQKRQLQQQQLLQESQGRLIRELRETVWNMKQIVEDQTRKNESQERVVVSLKDQLREQRKQNQRFERDISNQFQTLTQSTSNTSTPLPSSLNAAELLWPIKNFTKMLRQVRDREVNDPLVSEPFYTGQYGYKLSLWVYLNGRGKNHGTSVSVYARIMPGEHDAILSWPVRPSYTFTLFDQSEGEKESIVRTRKITGIKRVGGKHQGIERPGGGDRAVIVGFDDFVTHEQLVRRNYLKDDCFYLKLDAKFSF